jgi:drug/metabolite transporter (DMT)-like permease
VVNVCTSEDTIRSAQRQLRRLNGARVTRRGAVLFAAMCVIWGLPYLFIRIAVERLSPASLVFYRTGLGAAVLLPIALYRGEVSAALARWRWVAVFAGVEIMLPWLLLSDAEKHLSSSLTGLLVAAVPLIGFLLARVDRAGEPAAAGQLFGLGIGLLGVLALVGVDLAHTDLAAVAQVAAVACCYAVGPIILSKRLAELPSLGVISLSLTISAVGYLPFGANVGPHPVLNWRVLGSVAVLAVVCTALAFLLFFQLIAEIGPTRSTVITYVNPAVAVALGITVLSERLTVGMVVGFPLILVGSVLATLPRQRRADDEVSISAS